MILSGYLNEKIIKTIILFCFIFLEVLKNNNNNKNSIMGTLIITKNFSKRRNINQTSNLR